MKAIAINGSPRKRWNTAQLLEEALKGAESAGAKTELVNLYDLTYKGCVSCFGCKRKGAEPCRCYQKDGLSPVLEKVFQSDILLLGSPVYFGDVTGEMRKFLERLAFITMTYDDYSVRLFEGHINSAFFFTMNVKDEDMRAYEPMMDNTLSMLKRLGGRIEKYAAVNTLQFDDYSKYHAASFSEAEKRACHKQQFPKDKAAAFEIGFQMAKKAGQLK